MPRIRQYSAAYAEEDFRREVFRQIVDRYGDLSVTQLAKEAGIAVSTLNDKIRRSARNLDVHDFRLIVPVLKPDIAIVLKLLGYEDADIRKFKNKKQED